MIFNKDISIYQSIYSLFCSIAALGSIKPKKGDSMGRPTATPGRGTSKGQRYNPLSNWLERRAQRKEEERAIAFEALTTDTAENTNRLITILSTVDFTASRLPKTVLGDGESVSRLEIDTKQLVETLKGQTTVYTVDIRTMDTLLMQLAEQFKQAVKDGKTKMAYAAAMSLIKGINDFRGRIPVNGSPKEVEDFLENAEKYLSNCLDLVELAKHCDAVSEEHRNAEILLKTTEDSMGKLRTEHEKKMEKQEYIRAFNEITANKVLKADWTKIHHEIHDRLVEINFSEGLLIVQRYRTSQLKNQQAAAQVQVQQAHTFLSTLSSNMSSALVAKLDALQQQFNEALAASEAEFANAEERINRLRGTIGQAAANDLSGKIARETAQREVERMRREQDRQIQDARGHAVETIAGLRTKEQQEQLIEQAKAERLRRETEEKLEEQKKILQKQEETVSQTEEDENLEVVQEQEEIPITVEDD